MNGISQARSILAQALNLDLEEVGPDASIETLDAWDSLAHLRLILSLEDHLQVQLDPEVVIAVSSVPDIVAVLESHPKAV